MIKFNFTLDDLDQNDVYRQHQQVNAVFSENAKVRFRVDNDIEVTVYSEKPPIGSLRCKASVLKVHAVGGIIKFRLRANVSKREFVKSGNGKRVGIHEPELIAKWFKGQTARNGFSIENIINVSPAYYMHGVKGQAININTVDFEGILKVTDADKFKVAYENGIGASKGFGFGLLVADYVFQS